MYDMSAQNTLYGSHVHYSRRWGPALATNNGLSRVARIPVNFPFGKSLKTKFIGHSKRHRNCRKYAEFLRSTRAYCIGPTNLGKYPVFSQRHFLHESISHTNEVFVSPHIKSPHSDLILYRVSIAAIAGGVVAASILASISVVLFWLRRRRRRMEAITLPRQYIDEERPMARDKAHPPAIQDLGNEPSSDGAPQDPTRVSTDGVGMESENDRRGGETMSQRMRRVEAQVAALLTLGIPEGAPPGIPPNNSKGRCGRLLYVYIPKELCCILAGPGTGPEWVQFSSTRSTNSDPNSTPTRPQLHRVGAGVRAKIG
ncbi:hypothetical protein DFH07DRAFT_763827 [Mycena maculata]|uniref:Uncharacterized protein n=1 Tax=Mycena maculata TaxID=230809 RepID=A0AAD7KGQ4_9AGAR|nr:hypothetical protein DFH07DRAFT_763827 [Mycena maculata]